MIFTVHQAKTQLSKLIAATLAGEDVVIARGSTPVVRLTPLGGSKPTRRFGAYAGRFSLTEAFFDPLPDDEAALWSAET